MGGSSSGPSPFLAVLGSVALSVGAVAAAVSLKRAGCSWPPAILLAVSSFGIAIFATQVARRATDLRRSGFGGRLAALGARPSQGSWPGVEEKDEPFDESCPLSSANSAPEH